MVTVTREGSVTTRAGDHVFSLHANELVLVVVDGKGQLIAEQAVRDIPGIILHAITCLRHGLEFDVMRFADVPGEATRPVLAASVGPTWEDSWGEGQARTALHEVGQGGPLYSFEEVFGIPL